MPQRRVSPIRYNPAALKQRYINRYPTPAQSDSSPCLPALEAMLSCMARAKSEETRITCAKEIAALDECTKTMVRRPRAGGAWRLE